MVERVPSAGDLCLQYHYDRRGNLSGITRDGKEEKKFLYGPAGELREFTDAAGRHKSYRYNGLGFRTEEETPEGKVRFITDITRGFHNLLSAEAEGSVTDYTWDYDVLSMSGGKGMENRYFLQDELGSPMRLTGTDGCTSYAYGPFGEEIRGGRRQAGRNTGYTKQGNLIQPFAFTGYQKDAESGLYYAQARYYDPQTGRFASEDLIRGFTVMPQTLNHYSYCWNDPLKYVDRDGAFPNPIRAVGNAVSCAADSAGKFYQAHKETIDTAVKVTATVAVVAGGVALTAATFGAGAGVAVAATAALTAAYGGVQSAQNGTSVADGVMNGAMAGTVIGMGMAANTVAAAVGVGMQAASDLVSGHVSSPADYAVSVTESVAMAGLPFGTMGKYAEKGATIITSKIPFMGIADRIAASTAARMGVNALATGGVITAGEFARNTLTRPDMSTGNALHDAANKGVSAAYLSFGMLMLGEYLFPRTNGTVGCPEEGSGSAGGKKGGTSGGTQDPPANAYQGGSKTISYTDYDNILNFPTSITVENA